MFNNYSLQRVVLLSLSSLLLAFQFCFVCSLVCSSSLVLYFLLSCLLSAVGKGASLFMLLVGSFG